MPPGTAGDRDRRNQDLDDEIGHDLEMEAEELIRSGIPPEEARRSSRRDFGNVLLIKEDIRETWGWIWVERLLQDLRYTARLMLRDPGFSLTAVLSLALGIGIATALFSVVSALLLAPYPYARPGEIRVPRMLPRNRVDSVPFRVSQYLEIAKLPAFSGAMAECEENDLLTGEGATETLHGRLLSGNAFQFLGVSPLLGRTIVPADIHPDGQAEPVVVLSYKAWQHWFGGDPAALGKQLVLNNRPRTVIGIMPPRFGWWTDIWMPLPTDRYDRIVTIEVRLRPAVSTQNADEQLQSLLLSLARMDPFSFPRQGFTTKLETVPWSKAGRGMETAMQWLMLVAGLLLLISCAGVANQELARATVRSREIAVRISLGAGPARVLRQLFTESVSLSLAGGAAGVILSLALIPVITVLLPDLHGVRPDEVRVAVDGHVLLFFLATSLAAGVLCGIAPVVQCWRLNLSETLKDAPRTSGNHTAGGIRSFLVSAEVALSVVLLFAAIVTVRGFAAASERNLGFQSVRVLKAGYSLPPKFYPGYAGRMAFARTLLTRLQNLPGVQAAAIASLGGIESGLSISGQRSDAVRRVDVGFVSQDFAAALGIPLRAGRPFSTLEVDRADPVALINERAARLLWPQGGAIGARIRLNLLESILQNPGGSFLAPEFGASAASASTVTIVGVIADARADGELGIDHDPLVLLPYTLGVPLSRKIVLRTSGHPMLLWDALRREVAAIDPAETISNPWMVEGRLAWDEGRAEGRCEMALFGCVALVGLALTATGIYSVLSYNVACKTHEVGIRIALGATRRNVLSAIFVSGMRLVWIGLACGIPICFLLATQVDTGSVPKADAWAFGAILLLLTPPALLACYLPAKRAVRLDPSVALRHE